VLLRGSISARRKIKHARFTVSWAGGAIGRGNRIPCNFAELFGVLAEVKPPLRLVWLGFYLPLFAVWLQASAPLAATEDPLGELAPLPELIDFARARMIPIEKIEFAPEADGMRNGDRVTMLIALVRQGVERQWLAVLEADELTSTESKMKPPRDEVVYTATGLKLTFTNSRTALKICLVGPFVANGPTKNAAPLETRDRVLVSPEYLAHGLEPFARSGAQVGERLRAAGLSERDFHYGTKPTPLTEAELNACRKWFTRFTLSPVEERAENEGFFAATTFFDVARSVPQLNNLAQEVMVMPSLVSLVTHVGLNTSYVFGWVEVKAVATDRVPMAQPTYEFPVNVFFNGKHGAAATLTVTKPRPPLQVCGGIMAISAEYPGDPDRRFRLRVIAARPASR